ncbi:MAG: hypothetical protein SVU88_00460 [Candidatus Nanohaloarchaea archaeon]|nr:hypothetical protein [Candidatus Nanohaloarchaea archaeon]
MKCDRCGKPVDSRRAEIEHVLDQHGDALTSHDRDELKRELNQLGDAGGSRLPATPRTLGLAVLAVGLVAAAGYGLTATGLVSFSAGSGGTPTGAAVGPAGSTHQHAQFSVLVDGEEIDFSRDRYQMQSRKVHFEAGNGDRIHVHATGVTIGYALDTLGLGINSTCLTVHGETYCEDGGGRLSVTVDGSEIEKPASHVIRDGETIRISYSS